MSYIAARTRHDGQVFYSLRAKNTPNPGEDACGVKFLDATGRCVAWREQNMAHDSYFYSTFALDDGSYLEVETGATAYGGGGVYRPDAPDGVRAAYAAHLKSLADAAYAARVDVVGRRVVVARGRKVPVGTIGTVERLDAGGGPSWQRRPARACIKDDAGGRWWTAVTNLDVAT